jgi:hypothetical protein
MLRQSVFSISLVIATIGPGALVAAQDQDSAERQKALEELRAANESLEKTDNGLNRVGRVFWAASILAGREDLKKVSSVIDDASKPIQVIKDNADRIIDMIDRDAEAARREASGFLYNLKKFTLREQVKTLNQMRDQIRDSPVGGLVSDEVPAKFRVSADLMVRDLSEAKRRFGSAIELMRINAATLEERAAVMDEIGLRATAAVRVLRDLSDAIDKAAVVPPLTEALVEQYLDVDELSNAYGHVAYEATTKHGQLEQARSVEERLHDNLKSALDNLVAIDAQNAEQGRVVVHGFGIFGSMAIGGEVVIREQVQQESPQREATQQEPSSQESAQGEAARQQALRARTFDHQTRQEQERQMEAQRQRERDASQTRSRFEQERRARAERERQAAASREEARRAKERRAREDQDRWEQLKRREDARRAERTKAEAEARARMQEQQKLQRPSGGGGGAPVNPVTPKHPSPVTPPIQGGFRHVT